MRNDSLTRQHPRMSPVQRQLALAKERLRKHKDKMRKGIGVRADTLRILEGQVEACQRRVDAAKDEGHG